MPCWLGHLECEGGTNDHGPLAMRGDGHLYWLVKMSREENGGIATCDICDLPEQGGNITGAAIHRTKEEEDACKLLRLRMNAHKVMLE